MVFKRIRKVILTAAVFLACAAPLYPIPKEIETALKLNRINHFDEALEIVNRALAEERRREARLEEIEERVTALESQLSKISHQLAQPPSNQEVVAQLGDEYVEIQNELEALIREWEDLHQKIGT